MAILRSSVDSERRSVAVAAVVRPKFFLRRSVATASTDGQFSLSFLSLDARARSPFFETHSQAPYG